MRLAWLFPGQGAQRPGFLRRLPDHPAVRATLGEAAAVLGRDVQRLDEAQALEDTVAVQLGTVIAGVAVARALAAENIAADAVAGLSVGAFSAAVASKALAFADALPLVQLRGQCMARLAAPGSGMLAILGMSEREVVALVAEVSRQSPLYLASVNAPSEIVVSGEARALELALQAVHSRGASARRLAVGIPSHCALMDEVSQRLRTALSAIRIARPQVPYLSNHRARLVSDAAEVAADLCLNVSRTVRWHDAMTLLYEHGCRIYCETPPGQVLSTLVRDAFADARAVALERVPLADALLIARRGAP
jgi:malonate decarboxylase epsilon subunit